MVCIYCGGNLSVKNSRAQRRSNQTWRRRKCEQCGAVVTSIEAIDLSSAISVESSDGLQPFARNKLFISIYESCRHRPRAAADATYLTDTVVARLLPQLTKGHLPADAIIDTATNTLRHFDEAAAVQYAAFHPRNKNQFS